MDWETIEDQCLKDNKFFGRLIGVWPSQGKYLKYSIRSFIFITMMLTFIAQVARVVKYFSTDVLADQVIYLTIGIVLLIKQHNYTLNEDKLEELLNQIVSDRLVERPEGEVSILDLYSKRAAVLSTLYKVSISFCGFMFILMPTVPPILNFVAPLNESRSRELVYPSYYFVDEQQYYYPILVHMVLVALTLVNVYIGCDIQLVHVVHHACALLNISGYRFKHALDDVDLLNHRYNAVIMDKAYAKVSRSIEAHKKAVDYVDKIEACHMHYFFIMIGMIVTVFTVTFVTVATMEIGARYFTICAFTMGQLVHLLFLTVMGQFVINSNDEAFLTICEGFWYNGSPRTQLLYVLVLRKCLNPPKLTGGKMISLNLETFVQVLKASFSYYTVLRST